LNRPALFQPYSVVAVACSVLGVLVDLPAAGWRGGGQDAVRCLPGGVDGCGAVVVFDVKARP
jgi:hypothetical protein